MIMRYTAYDAYEEEYEEKYFDVECHYCKSSNLDVLDEKVEYIDAEKIVIIELKCSSCNAHLQVADRDLEIVEY